MSWTCDSIGFVTVSRKKYIVHWCPGNVKLSDYHTKHHASKHHKHVCPLYVQAQNSPKDILFESPSDLLGCVETY